METRKIGAGYQILLVALLSLNFGIVFFDRNAFSYLTPFIQPDLALSNTQIGLIGAGMSLTWALSGILIGAASDRVQRRKIFLIAATITFSLCSVLSGLAATFALLLGARMLMGAAEGGVLPVSQSLIVREIPGKQRGLAMGVVQTTGAALLGAFLAPIVLVALAEAFGWRVTFFLAGVPGLICALLMWLLIREPEPLSAPAAAAARVPLRAVLANRNILICTGVAILLVAFMLTAMTFMPLYLTQVAGLSPIVMGVMLSMFGLATAFYGITLPTVSDRIGRKPVMVAAPLAGLLIPLAALFGGGSTALIAICFFVGCAYAGSFVLFMSLVPSESAPPLYIATSMGIVVAAGEAIGGVAGPTLAGMAADAFGLTVINWILIGLALAAAALALGLRETAPAVLAKRGAAQPSAAG